MVNHNYCRGMPQNKDWRPSATDSTNRTARRRRSGREALIGRKRHDTLQPSEWPQV